MLNFCSERPGVFVTDAVMNNEKYVDPPFINFHHCKNISSCSFHKQLLPEHGKTCPSFMNIEHFDKGKVTKRKIIALKSFSIGDFHSEYYIPEIEKLVFHLPHVYIIGKIIVQVNVMACL